MHGETARIDSGAPLGWFWLKISLSMVHQNDQLEGGVGSKIHEKP
jgi:hypothetical protein